MTTISNLNVLIVDRSDYSGFELRNSFVSAGANTHVVASFASAVKLLENKRIDAALVEFSKDPETIAFCKALSEKNIPCVFTSEPATRYASARKADSGTIAAIRSVLARRPEQTV